MICSLDPKRQLAHQRISDDSLAKQLSNYDVISFDVFGTLILRPFSSPRVLFSIMEERLGIYKFAKIRVDSEDEIRNRKISSLGHDNVTLKEIYDLISKKTNLDAESTANFEYELELAYCIANPYFMKVVSLCKKENKTLIVCTDMYLSQVQIKGLLGAVGYPEFDNLFVSSEWNKSKKKGDLFEQLKAAYPGKRIIHVGDDQRADIENAEQNGVNAYYYPNVNTFGGRTRIDGMSYITSRIYSALVNIHFYAEMQEYSDPYKLGYIYGGIYVLGFVQWVNRFVSTHNIDKVLFLSRDGDVYSQIYDLLPNHKMWEYFYWSRFAGTKITAMENYYEFCQRMIWHKARGVYNIQIGHVLSFFGIDHLVYKLSDYDLSATDILSKQNAQQVETFFFDHKEEILRSFQPDIDATLEHIKKAVGDAKRIAIVDVGWAGTGPFILKTAINKYLKNDCKVYALLAGFRQPIDNMAALYTMDDFIHSYLFSPSQNRDLLDQHCNYGSKKNNLLLEIFTQSCAPSFLGYSCNGLEFDWEESENYETISMITEGILDFASEYISIFQNDQFIMNISSYDAYLPFNELKNTSNSIDAILEEMIISRGKFYDADHISKETWLSFLYKEE